MGTSRVRDAPHQSLLLRELNERVWSLTEGSDDVIGLVCECGRTTCAEAVKLSRSVYESACGSPERFIVVVGHEVPEAERVVEVGQHYVVVERRTEAL